MYGLICSTLFQGLTISAGDIYETLAEARQELEDYQEHRIAEGMDEDEDMYIEEIEWKFGGKLVAKYSDKPITITDPENLPQECD